MTSLWKTSEELGQSAAEFTQLLIDNLGLDSAKQIVTDHFNSLLSSTQTISSALQSAYAQFLTAIKTLPPRDPLIIDGANDGLELNSWQNSGVLFDLNGDGLSEATGWVKPATNGGDELFLALDKNQNGFFALKNCETAILAKNALRSEATQGQAQARL